MQSQVRGPSHMLHHLPGIPFPFSQITQHPLVHFLDHVFEAVFLMSVLSESTCIPYKHCVMRYSLFTPFTLLFLQPTSTVAVFLFSQTCNVVYALDGLLVKEK